MEENPYQSPRSAPERNEPAHQKHHGNSFLVRTEGIFWILLISSPLLALLYFLYIGF